MKTTTQTTVTVPTYEQYLYNTAEKAVYIALRARHEKSGLHFLEELQNSWKQDQTARTATKTAERLSDLEELHESHRKGYEFYNARAQRITIDEVERGLCRLLAKDFHDKCMTESAQIADIYDTLNITYSDRADIVQSAVEQILINEQTPAPITATILGQYGADTVDDLEPEELEQAQASANFRAVINAAGRAINQVATSEALNRNTTVKTPATPEEVTLWINTYGDTGKDVKIPCVIKRARASDCFDTMEYIDNKKTKGWYRIRHYVTVAPYQYIENYTEDEEGETDLAYLKSYNPFVSNYGDVERLEELCESTKLNKRQRTFLAAFANRCRYESDFKACKDYAFQVIGITSETNKTTFFNRLKKALKPTK